MSEAEQQRLVSDFYQRSMTARELLCTQQSLEKSRRDAGGAPCYLPYAHLTKARRRLRAPRPRPRPPRAALHAAACSGTSTPLLARRAASHADKSCLPPPRFPPRSKAEAAELPEGLAAPCRRVYANLRNLLLWRWSVDPERYLAMREAAGWVRVRGAVRRRYLELLPHAHRHLTLHGHINSGASRCLPPPLPRAPRARARVAVVGGGAAGLACARQLAMLGAISPDLARSRLARRAWKPRPSSARARLDLAAISAQSPQVTR